MAVYEFSDNDTLMLKEFDIYGSSRVGILHESDTLSGTGIIADTVTDAWQLNLGDKEYEQTNHLGNVLSTITDKPIAIDLGPNGNVDYFDPEYVTAQDYYPFGMLQPDRHIEANDSCYRFGFNGKEKDNDTKGLGNWQDYGMRLYDTRICRFPSVDPITKRFPELTPYQFATNNPIMNIDMDGLEGTQSTTNDQNQNAAAADQTNVVTTSPELSSVKITPSESWLNRMDAQWNKWFMGKSKMPFGVELDGESDGKKTNPTDGPTMHVKFETVQLIEDLIDYAGKPNPLIKPGPPLTEELNTGTSERMKPKGAEKFNEKRNISSEDTKEKKNNEKNNTTNGTAMPVLVPTNATTVSYWIAHDTSFIVHGNKTLGVYYPGDTIEELRSTVNPVSNQPQTISIPYPPRK